MAMHKETTSSLTFGDVLRYALLPGFAPRIRDLVGTGFGSFAFFVALVYQSVRLLPAGHPFLNPQNMGKFGVIAVVMEAARYIKFNRVTLRQNNIDQIIVFLVILAAIFLLVFQFFTLMLAIFIPSAMAMSFSGGGPSFSSPFAMFDTPQFPGMLDGGSLIKQPQNVYDISFMFLDRVFGVPGVFNSCIALTDVSCKPTGATMYGGDNPDYSVNDPSIFPWPYHHALHGLFQFYSVGLLVIAVFLMTYFTIVVVVETAQTGTPFGKRFEKVWAPLRLVTAAGLLIPISFGLNAGQYVVLYAAKWGANFATNGWIGFNVTLSNLSSTSLGGGRDLISIPNTPTGADLVQFMSIVHACKEIQDEFILPAQAKMGNSAENSKIIPYLVRAAGEKSNKETALELTAATTYKEAVEWSQKSDIIIRYGVKDSQKFKSEKGNVSPVCGELNIPVNFFPMMSNDPKATSAGPGQIYYDGATKIMEGYWALIKEFTLVTKRGEGLSLSGYSIPWNIRDHFSSPSVAFEFRKGQLSKEDGGGTPTLATASDRALILWFTSKVISAIVDDAYKVEQAAASSKFAIPADLIARGWAAAGIWYNRVAQMNGTFTSAAWNTPQITTYPATMMLVADYKRRSQMSLSPKDVFSPSIGTGSSPIRFPQGDGQQREARTYWDIVQWWQADPAAGNSLRTPPTGNVILDTINMLFGTSGLFSIYKNANTHPMAQLSSIGKSLVDRSVVLLGIGLGGTLAQPWLDKGPKAAASVITNFAFSILSIGASAGFILYYVIPFLPFIYFFFAVAGWVKAIFEAMVGVPLWALAHIRIDGNGLPGSAASAGYFLILEIMLRPILIVFGLISAVTIYAASVHVLNDIFSLAVSNVTGVNLEESLDNNTLSMENLRGSIDTFFYTIMYVMLVYMLGQSSFKLIDMIPASMLRWFGTGVNAFRDSGAEAAGNLVNYGTFGSQIAFGQLATALKQGAGGTSELAKGMAEKK